MPLSSARLVEPDASHRRPQPGRPRRSAGRASSTSTSSAQGLIEARVQSLLTQGDIIAGAIAASATVDTDSITIDPDQLLQMQAGETARLAEDDAAARILDQSRACRALLRRLVTPTQTRARIYDRDGALLLDSRSFYSRGDILRMDLPPIDERGADLARAAPRTDLRSLFRPATRRGARRSARPTARRCRKCSRRSAAQRRASCASTRGARPSFRWRCRSSASGRSQGALLLSTQGGDIDAIIASERFALLQVFLVRGRRDDRPVAVSRRRHRRTGPPARGGCRTGAPGHEVAPGNPRFHRPRPTRSAICRARCAT